MTQPPSQTIEPPVSETGPAQSKWSVGTLTYTTGGLVALFCWLLWGDFAWQLKERSAGPVVQVMLRKFDISDFLAGLFLLSLPSAIGLLLGPVISYRSDRHRGKWGRRIPFLLIPTPITALSMVGLAFSPAVGTWVHHKLGLAPESLNFTIIMVMGLFWTLFEIVTVIANAVFGGLINDVVPRQLIGRFFGLFRAVSLLTGMLFNFYLIGKAKEYYTAIFLGIGAVYGVGFTLMCLNVKEGQYPEPEPPVPGAATGFIAAVKSYFRDCFTKPYYLWVFAFMAIAGLSFVPINLYSVYASESFGLSLDAYGKYLVATYACSLVLAYPLGWMADKFHAIRMGLAAMAAYAVVMGIGFVAIDGPRSFGMIFLAHGVLSGCYFTGAASLGQVLFPRISFSQFASAAGMISAVCNIAFAPMLGALLDRMGHNYRYTFGFACLLAIVTLLIGLVVYRRFIALGGPKGYVAPV